MNKLFKHIVLIIILLSFSFIYSKVEAKDIEIHATSLDDGIEFQSYVGSYQASADDWESHYKSFEKTFNKKQFRYILEGYLSGTYEKKDFVKEYNEILSGFTTNSIRSNSYIIHNKPFSLYTRGGNYGYSSNLSNTATLYTNIGDINSNVKSIEFERLTNGYQIIKPYNNDIKITVNNNYFTKSYLDELVRNLSSYKAGSSSTSHYFYISEPLAWHLDSYDFYDTRNLYGDISKNVGIKTSSEINNINIKELGYADKIDYIDGKKYESFADIYALDGKNGNGLASYLNYYDNKLYIPKNVLDPSKIYVRHIDENGNNIGYNDSEILIDEEGKESILNNSEFVSNNAYSSIYPEYYEISNSQTLKVSRLLNIVKEGNYYQLENVTKSTKGSYNEAVNNMKNAQPFTSDTVSISASNQTQVTVITFKYKKVPINNDEKSQGGIETLDSDDINNNCQMSYTPTNEYIKPYLVANKFKFKDLKYSYTQDGNKVKYVINTFKIDKLISGTIANNDSEGTLGQIFGAYNDKWTLLLKTTDNQTQEDFPVNNQSIEDALTSFNSSYKYSLPTQKDLKEFVNNNKTTKEDYTKTFHVPENRYNGLRIPKLIANYQEYNVLNNSKGTINYDDASNKANVLVYNPIKVEAPTVKSEGVVNHSSSSTDSVIQKNADFELSIKAAEGQFYTNHNYSEYLSGYYLIFDIDIVKTENTEYTALYNTSGNTLVPISKNIGDVIQRGTLIELNKDATIFKAKASNNSETGDIISQGESKITLIGVSNNMPGDVLKNDVLKYEKLNTLNVTQLNNYISIGDNTQYTIDGNLTSVKKDYCDTNYTKYRIHDLKYHNDKEMYGDAYYFAKAVEEITNIGRIYDFKITDCSDVDYKSTFRKTGTNKINELTGIQYFSGLKEFSIYSKDVNTLVNRDNLSISSSTASKTIIPLGPYKSTNTSYINAPKMGYRISFDLKTSGYYKYTAENASKSKREILIKPSYYYISKDGKTFKDGINLYYKNSSGNYVKFVGSDYTIYFKPKDGYRSISNSATAGVTDVMSEQLEPLVIGANGGFTLNYKMMSTADNNFVQAWYGEFKLPNSTIAVEGTNISKPLTDGYIGVKFDITCIDIDASTGNEKKISYNTDNQNANPKINTTQWDYEGFIGFDTPGQNANNLSIQLEKGTWIVNDTDSSSRTSAATYKDIKSTVVLFDIDNRAANDFD